jgi:hypothetical protein
MLSEERKEAVFRLVNSVVSGRVKKKSCIPVLITGKLAEAVVRKGKKGMRVRVVGKVLGDVGGLNLCITGESINYFLGRRDGCWQASWEGWRV